MVSFSTELWLLWFWKYMLELEFLLHMMLHCMKPTYRSRCVPRSLDNFVGVAVTVLNWNDVSGHRRSLWRSGPRAIERLLLLRPLRVDPEGFLFVVQARFCGLGPVRDCLMLELVVALEVRILHEHMLRCSGQVGRRLEVSLLERLSNVAQSLQLCR